MRACRDSARAAVTSIASVKRVAPASSAAPKQPRKSQHVVDALAVRGERRALACSATPRLDLRIGVRQREDHLTPAAPDPAGISPRDARASRSRHRHSTQQIAVEIRRHARPCASSRARARPDPDREPSMRSRRPGPAAAGRCRCRRRPRPICPNGRLRRQALRPTLRPAFRTKALPAPPPRSRADRRAAPASPTRSRSRLLDLETLRRADVLELDRAERRSDGHDRFDDLLRVTALDQNRNAGDVSELGEQRGLAFHHGQPARAPMLPRPRMALPLVTIATVFLMFVYSAASSGSS